MDAKLFMICVFVGWIATARGQGLSALCQRFPNNPNCGSPSSGSVPSSNPRPVDPQSLGLPPPPNQGGAAQPAASSGSANSDPCSSWRPVYDKYCVGATIDAQYQSSCAQFQQTCLGGGASGAGLQSGGPVNPSAGGVPPPSSGQPQPQGSSVGSTWSALTEKAQAEQAQEALNAANNGQANCGQYQQNYNVWCGGVKPINPVYCNTLGRVCQQQAANTAAGQQPFGAPFQNGGVGGGAGSTRPLGIGQNFGVGPFANIGRNVGINPLKGLSTDRGVDIPIAGLGFHRTSGIDWGGLPGVAQAGAALGRRRRRWAMPVGVDYFGNVVYVLH